MYVCVFGCSLEEGFHATIKQLHKQNKLFVCDAIWIAEKKDAGNEKLLNSECVTIANRSKVFVIKWLYSN